ncbi:MAG: hypothetical protein ACLP2Y_04625 [Limisphaerales bacterium]
MKKARRASVLLSQISVTPLTAAKFIEFATGLRSEMNFHQNVEMGARQTSSL